MNDEFFLKDEEVNVLDLLASRIKKTPNIDWSVWAKYNKQEKCICLICNQIFEFDNRRGPIKHGMMHLKEYNLLGFI